MCHHGREQGAQPRWRGHAPCFTSRTPPGAFALRFSDEAVFKIGARRNSVGKQLVLIQIISRGSLHSKKDSNYFSNRHPFCHLQKEKPVKSFSTGAFYYFGPSPGAVKTHEPS